MACKQQLNTDLRSFHVEEFLDVRFILDILPGMKNDSLLLCSLNDEVSHVCSAISACNVQSTQLLLSLQKKKSWLCRCLDNVNAYKLRDN